MQYIEFRSYIKPDSDPLTNSGFSASVIDLCSPHPFSPPIYESITTLRRKIWHSPKARTSTFATQRSTTFRDASTHTISTTSLRTPNGITVSSCAMLCHANPHYFFTGGPSEEANRPATPEVLSQQKIDAEQNFPEKRHKNVSTRPCPCISAIEGL